MAAHDVQETIALVFIDIAVIVVVARACSGSPYVAPASPP